MKIVIAFCAALFVFALVASAHSSDIPDHADARKTLVAAFSLELGREPTGVEVQMLTSMSGHETGFYGSAFRERTRNNWGAIKLPGSIVLDSYASPLEGARAFVRSTLASKRPGRAERLAFAVSQHSTMRWAQALYDTHYFTGDPKLPPEQRVRAYAKNMLRNAQKLADSMGEPMVLTLW